MRNLLIIGPRPPAIGGGVSSVNGLIEYLREHTAICPAELNSAPPGPGRPTKLLRFETVWRAILICGRYLRTIGKSDTVLVYAANQFILTMVPILLLIARALRVPFLLKPLGGDLAEYMDSLPSAGKSLLRWSLTNVDGVLPQTSDVRDTLLSVGCSRVCHVPGYRQPPSRPRSQKTDGGLRLVYLAHIRRAKGPLDLLTALRLLAERGHAVACDFFGPVFADVEAEFHASLIQTPGAEYRGTLASTESGAEILAHYDGLVLPSYYRGEGHPGAIIEALLAGIPVVATAQGGILELIRHNENGLIVPARDPRALADAIERLLTEKGLWPWLASNSLRSGRPYRADVVVPQMLARISDWSRTRATVPVAGDPA